MNFTYLENKKDFSDLLNYCKECECFVNSRVDVSITAARKAMEYMVKLLYGTHITPNIRGLTLFDMLSDYDFINYIGINCFSFVFKKGGSNRLQVCLANVIIKLTTQKGDLLWKS